jgi:hypothetical protein
MGTLKQPALHGSISGSASAVVLPSIAVPLTVILKAVSTNAGSVYLGLSTSVIVPLDQTTDALGGFELDAGDQIELGVDNLSELFLISDNVGDSLVYFIFGGG